MNPFAFLAVPLTAAVTARLSVRHHRRRPARHAAVAVPVAAGLILTVGDPVAGAIAVALVPAGVVAAAVDTETLRLPDPLTLGGYRLVGVIELAGAVLTGRGDRLLLAAALSALCLVVLSIPARSGALGRGDVKLAGLLGLAVGWVGPGAVLVFLLVGHGIGGAVALGALRRGRRGARLAFGPALLAGGGVAMALCG